MVGRFRVSMGFPLLTLLRKRCVRGWIIHNLIGQFDPGNYLLHIVLVRSHQNLPRNILYLLLDRRIGQYLAGKYNTEIQKNKTLKAQADKAFKFVDHIDFIQQNSREMQMLIAAYMNIGRAKLIAVNKLNNVASMRTFVETSNGYKVTAPEGYVAISGSSAVKLIDRLEFSNLNFNVPKNWG